MAGILDFLGGENLQQIVNGLSEKTGVSTDKVGTVLDSLKQMLGQGENIFLEAIENSFGGKGGNIGDMLTSFLDKNKDGNVMDDIMGGIGNLFGGK